MMWKQSKLIGKRVNITDEQGKYWGDWGTVIGYDGEYYHVAFAGDKNNVLVFDRREIRVSKH